MNGFVAIAAVIGLLLALGMMLGLASRQHFSPRWLLIAALLVLLNDVLLTRAYGLLPDLIGGAWNWQGKLLALLACVVVASLPSFGWKACGLQLAQQRDALRAALPVAGLYCAFFLVIALAFPADAADAETMAFQLTMPGIAEEIFYRGTLLLALDRAFASRKSLLGVDWGWGALLSCLLFGMDHAFGYSDAGFSFDAITMAFTALPSFIAVWLRLRTGSLVLPALLHNFGNALPIFL